MTTANRMLSPSLGGLLFWEHPQVFLDYILLK